MADEQTRAYDALLAAAQAVVNDGLDEAEARTHPCDVHNDDVKAQHMPAPLEALYHAVNAARRAAPSSPVGDDGLPVSDSVDTEAFRRLAENWSNAATECNPEKVLDCWAALITHIDAWAARRQRKLREAWEDDDKACVGAYAEENGRLKEELRAARRAAGSTAGVPNYGVLPILDERKHAVEAFDADYKATTMGEWEWGLFLAGWLARSTLHARLATFAEQPQETE